MLQAMAASFTRRHVMLCVGGVWLVCLLLVLQAMGYFFGGAGPTYSPKALGQTLLDARGSLQGVTSWLPAPYHDLLTLDPEAGEEQVGLLTHRVYPFRHAFYPYQPQK